MLSSRQLQRERAALFAAADTDLLGDALAELVHVGDDAHKTFALGELVENIQGLVQHVVRERAEALVNEQRLHLPPARVAAHHVGKAQRQGKRGEEGLAPGERAGGALLAALGVYLSWRFRNRGRLWGRIWSLIKGVGDGLSSCLRMKQGWGFIAYTVVIWGLYWLMCATVMWSLQGISPEGLSPAMAASLEKINALGMSDALFLMFAGALSSIVPVPGGFGAFHTVVAGALLSIYGIPFPVGLIFATLSHESQVVTDALCGAVSYAYETLHK